MGMPTPPGIYPLFYEAFDGSFPTSPGPDEGEEEGDIIWMFCICICTEERYVYLPLCDWYGLDGLTD